MFYSEDSSITVAVIEIKAGSLDVSKACSQITAGALVAESLIQHENTITFLPIILHGRGLKTIERRNLEKRGRISFRGKQTATICKRCETEFEKIVSEHS